MNIYIARQPIFTPSKDVHAYELLFRGGTQNYFPEIDGDVATSRVLSGAFFTTGLDQITSGRRAYINFPKRLILEEIPLMFPAESTTVEILENVDVDERIVEACTKMTAKGYAIALDDFVYRPGIEPLIRLSHVIKIDFRRSSPQEIEEYLERFSPMGIRFLAEKVETEDEFERAKKMGFSYFQGYFFCKPEVLRDTEIPALKMNLLSIMAEARRDGYDIARLEALIEKDVGISYKLLRYLNSPFFRRRIPISSLRQAIVMLGEKGIRSFLSVIVMAELGEEKPDELIKSSIVRARMCERFAEETRSEIDPSELFMLGLFSHIDAILDSPMENILARLPLAGEIKKALLGGGGPLAPYLDLAAGYQEGRWEDASRTASLLGLDDERIPEIYLDALGYADALYEETR